MGHFGLVSTSKCAKCFNFSRCGNFTYKRKTLRLLSRPGGASFFFGPGYLLEQDVVLVTFNYRLGPLGFLTTDDKTAAGNQGLRDQVMVLNWVKANIGKFGGDPDKVTIFGEDSGAASVTLMAMSPLAKGLFHRAIALSGETRNSILDAKNVET